MKKISVQRKIRSIICIFLLFSLLMSPLIHPIKGLRFDYRDDVSDIDIVVSDGITSNAINENDEEFPPSATLFRFHQSHPVFKYKTADRISDVAVSFFIKHNDSDWISLGNEIIKTDSKGIASMPALRSYIPDEVLKRAPIDLQLKAVATFSDGSTVSDARGIIRIVDTEHQNNHGVLAVDHDNTLHDTGGVQAMRQLNRALNRWPVVDSAVTTVINTLLEKNTDVVIVSSLPTYLRSCCRSQIIDHFETDEIRQIPLIIKADLSYQDSRDFKAAALEMITQLYGRENMLGMVGDNPDHDGFAAFANALHYIAYDVDYLGNIERLNTNGFGYIDPALIASDWNEVVAMVNQGEQVNNFFLQNKQGFLNIAHRGGGNLRPENTILCYRHALEMGADVLEADLHATEDGVIVVSHDETVDRCTNGSGYITNYTFAELRTLDAGYWFTPDDGLTYPYRNYTFEDADHLKIPTLEEVFSDPVIDHAPMVLEIKQQKPSIVDDVLDFIDKYGMQHQVIIGSFDKLSLDELRQRSEDRNMEIITSFCEEEVLDFYLTPLPFVLLGGYEPSGRVLQVPIEYELSGITIPVVTSFFINKARYLGLKVQVWTVNDADEMRWLMTEKNVDGIMTDDPKLLQEVIEQGYN